MRSFCQDRLPHPPFVSFVDDDSAPPTTLRGHPRLCLSIAILPPTQLKNPVRISKCCLSVFLTRPSVHGDGSNSNVVRSTLVSSSTSLWCRRTSSGSNTSRRLRTSSSCSPSTIGKISPRCAFYCLIATCPPTCPSSASGGHRILPRRATRGAASAWLAWWRADDWFGGWLCAVLVARTQRRRDAFTWMGTQR